MTKKKNLPPNASIEKRELQPRVTATSRPISEVAPVIELDNKAKRVNYFISMVLVALVAIGVYYNSRLNNFVLDDHGIIKSNKITKAGLGMDNIKTIFTTSHRKGDVSDLEHSLYRPVAKLIFAAQWQWGDGDPNYFHKWNIFYFMVCCVMLFMVLYQATKKNWILSLVISLLFVVHPIHTEVVANVKSLDEILGGIGVLGALLCFHEFSKSNNFLYLPIALISYCVGIFSKESTIVAVALVPLYMYYFTPANLKQIIIATVTMAIGAGIFLMARENAIGWFLHLPQKDPSALDNVLALTKIDQTKVGGYQMSKFIPTVVYLMGYYLYILFKPFPLSCDYSYASVNVKEFGDWEFLLSFAIFAFAIYYAIKTFKQKNIIGFGILWFFIASSIVSNLFIVIGTSLGERLMFLPSIGFCIVVVGIVYQLLQYAKKYTAENLSFVDGLKKHAVLFGILAVVGVIFGQKTIARNKEWFKDYTLFSNDVKNFGSSTHLLFYWGNHLSSSEYHEILKSQGQGENEINQANQEAINTFKASMAIYPALPSDGYNQYGKAFYNLKKFNPTYLDSADYYYKKAHGEDTTNSVFMNNIGTVFFERAIPLQRIDFYDSAKKYFYKAYVKDTTMIDYMNNLGAIYGTQGFRTEAIDWFYKGYKADSLSEGAILSCRSIAITYQALGDSNQTRAWQNKAKEINDYRMKKLQSGGF